MKFTAVTVLAAATAAFSMAQGLPTTKILTVDVAQMIAQEAMMKCRADGYHVTVTVVDAGNFPKALLRDDGANLATLDVARMKATSVILQGRPSGPATPPPAGTTAPAAVIPGTINAVGGVPIKSGNMTIGAIAVSGAPGGDKDAACANAALTKFADKLQ